MGSQGRAATAGREATDDDTSSATKPAHFIFVPLMMKGHLIPAVDTALLLATHGALCTIVGTPATAVRVRQTIESAQNSGPPIRLAEFPLDHAESGFPEGADNDDMFPPMYLSSYFAATALLRAPIESYLRANAPYPTCIVSDFCHPWTTELAANLGVPRLSFFSMCAFYLLCQHNVERFNAYDGVADDNEPIVVPGLETRFEVTRATAPGFFRRMPAVPFLEEFGNYIERARAEANGVIINTFSEMEPEYVAGYAAARGMKIWTVGPVSLYHQRAATLATRGNVTAVDAEDCLQWLDGKEPNSVIYVSFGSIVQSNPKQIVELGLGLEASGHPFIWALRNAEEYDDETVSAFLRDLEARVAGRGLLIRGWAPQVLILSHAAVGGFVTHCGWNSTMEAVAAGLPVVTWPHFADQFLNEKMAVELLGIGVSVGIKEPLMYRAVEKEIVVGRNVVDKAVRSLMGSGEEADERRRQARALADKARAAMQEGGSSHANLLDLVERFKAAGAPHGAAA